MKQILFLLVLFFTAISFSQENLLLLENNLKESDIWLKQSFASVDQLNNNISVFIEDYDEIYGYLFNDKLEKVSEITAKTLPNKYRLYLGNGVNDLQHNIYISNNNRTKFGVYSFDFKTQKVEVNKIDIELKKEKFLQALTYNNSFYIFTVLKNKSIINVYQFSKDQFEKKSIDLSHKTFLGSQNEVSTLYKILLKGPTISVVKIEPQNPNSIELVSESFKFYTTKNGFKITLDSASSFTQILTVDLDTLEANVENIDKPYIENQLNIKTNSFILNDRIFQFSTNPKEFVFNVKNTSTKQLIKEYRITEEDSIHFKNSPIIQEGGTYDTYRELEKTKKFLRKISKGQTGISIYKNDNKLQITLGSYIKNNGGGGMVMMPGSGGAQIVSNGSVNHFHTTTMFAYNSYTATKSTYINCLFDENLNHVEGEIKGNIFDRINEFKKKNKNYIQIETLFHYKGYVVLGAFVRNTTSYRLLKFKD